MHEVLGVAIDDEIFSGEITFIYQRQQPRTRLEIFRNFNFSVENKIIFTMDDITSLYTVIANNEGLQALKYFFNQRPIKKPSSETLLRLADVFRLVTTTSKSTVLQ